MARPLRIEYQDAFYHIIQRGFEKRNILKKNQNKTKFLQYLSQSYQKYQSICHSYCLMDNHYHLIIQTPKANLTKVMHYVNASYAIYYNKRNKRTGPLYQGRYKSILIEADQYLDHLSRYIHLNPVRAKIVKNPQDYPWSSYQYFLRKKAPEKWLEPLFILSNFGKKAKEASSAYRDFVLEGRGREKEIQSYIKENTHHGLILGSNNFSQNIYDKYIKRKKDTEIPVTRCFQKDNGLTKERVESIVRNIVKDEAKIRKFTIYTLKRYTQKTLKEISASYKGIGYTGVSILCKRLEEKRKKDKNTGRAIAKIESMCNVKT